MTVSVKVIVNLVNSPDAYGNLTCFKWDDSEYESRVMALEERKAFVADKNSKGAYWFLHDTEGFCYLVRKEDQLIVGVIESQYMNIGTGNMYNRLVGMNFYPSEGCEATYLD